MLVLLLATAFFLAFSNGANDNFKGFATVWGSASLQYRTALILATVATVAGGVASVIIAKGLLAQFSGKGLVPDTLANAPSFALAVAGAAGITVIAATRLGFPISTTHALVGGLVGAGIGNGAAVNFGKLNMAFVLPLLTSPILAALIAFLVYSVAKRVRKPVDDCVCVVNGETVMADGTLAFTVAPSVIIASEEACDAMPTPIARASVPALLNGVHLLSASAICFARGVNDTPKLAALLLTAGLFTGVQAAVGVTLAMAVGGWLLARRVAETMSLKISQLDAVQGTSANLITAAMVITASKFGLPVSTTHVSVGSIIGTGGAAGTLDLSMTRAVLLSWLITLPFAAACGWLIAHLV
jgi:inorganic phosphate transporter, PiT family